MIFTLYFVITLESGLTIKEYFPEQFNDQTNCEEVGWDRVVELQNQILANHPNMQGFEIECSEKKLTPIYWSE